MWLDGKEYVSIGYKTKGRGSKRAWVWKYLNLLERSPKNANDNSDEPKRDQEELRTECRYCNKTYFYAGTAGGSLSDPRKHLLNEHEEKLTPQELAAVNDEIKSGRLAGTSMALENGLVSFHQSENIIT